MRHKAAMASKAHTRRITAQYEHNVKPHTFSEGDLVLLYDQEDDNIGIGKFEPLWHGPYIVKCVLEKGAYESIDFYGIPLSLP